MSDITLSILTQPFLGWNIVEMKATEDYSGLSKSTLLCYTDQKVSIAELIGEEVFWMIDGSAVGQDTRFMGGVVQSIEQFDDRDTVYNKHYYLLHTTNALGPLQKNQVSRSWVNKTVLDVIRDVVGNYLFEQDYSRCCKQYEKIDYIVQYEQSDFSFLQVLCAEHGLFYYQSIDTVGSPIMRINFSDHFTSYHAKENDLYPSSLRVDRADLSNWRNTIDSVEQAQPIFNISCSTKAVANTFHGDDYHPKHADADYAQDYNNSYGVAELTAPVDIYPLNIANTVDKIKRLQQISDQHHQQQMHWCFTSDDKHFCLGKVVSIKKSVATNAMMTLPNELLPIEVEHFAKDYSNLQNAQHEVPHSILNGLHATSSQFYTNQVKAIEWKLAPYIPVLDVKHKAKMPGLLTGRVMAQPTTVGAKSTVVGGQAVTIDAVGSAPDDLGRVAVYMPWDANNPEQYYHLCPSFRVATRQNGITYAPHMGDEVLLMPIDDRPDRFIIIGSAYNSKTPLPLDLSNNHALAGIKTSGRYGNNPHFFYGDQTKGQERIIMQSYYDYYENVGNDIDPYRDAAKQAKLSKKIAQNFSQFVHDDMTIEVKDESLTIHAAEAMVFNVGGSQLELLPDRINLTGSVIELEALLGKSGPLVALGDQHSCPKHNPDDSPHVGGPVITGSSNVSWADRPAARMGDLVKCQGGSTNPICQGHFGITVNGQPAAVLGHQTTHGGQITSGVPNVVALPDLNLGLGFEKKDKNYDVQVKFKLVASSDYDPVITHALLNIDAHDEKQASHTDHPTDQLRGETIISDVTGGDYDIRLSPQARELAIYNVNGQPCFPYYRSAVKIPSSPNPDDKTINADRQFECKVLWPIMVLNCRAHGRGYEQAKAAGASDEIDPLDIQYFKKNGNNVTVFIHGYNVEIGALGDEYVAAKIEPTAWDEFWYMVGAENDSSLAEDRPTAQVSFETAPYKASIVRDVNIISQQLKQSLPSDYKPNPEREDVLFNGTGAYNWAINMEDTLNQAAGFVRNKVEGYEKYTRCLHVTWSGNWGNQNYGEAVDQAMSKYEARRLATALVALKKAGLEVNIIAHSLGNGFLLETMQILATEHQGVVMDHVFMWEGAVPNNVFNRPPLPNNQSDRWDYKQSLDAMKKVTVLHSYNDNILGPFPTSDKQKAQLSDVYRAKPAIEWFSAYLSKLLKLESLYLIAMGLQVETHLILKPEVQEVSYQYLLQYHQHLVSDNPTLEQDQRDFDQGMYMPTLAQQMRFVAQTGHYQSLRDQIMHGIKKFAADLQNAKSDLNTYINLHPKIKSVIAPILCLWNEAKQCFEVVDEVNKKTGEVISFEEWMERCLIVILAIGTLLAPEAFIPIDIAVAEIMISFQELCESEKVAEFISKTNETIKDVHEDVEKTEKGAKLALNRAEKLMTYELKKHHFMGAAYLVHMLTDKRINAMHVPALGYAPHDNRYLRSHAKKFNLVNQTEWLFQHSGMKIPSKDLMTNIIIPRIVNSVYGMKHFGKYSI